MTCITYICRTFMKEGVNRFRDYLKTVRGYTDEQYNQCKVLHTYGNDTLVYFDKEIFDQEYPGWVIHRSQRSRRIIQYT